LKNEIAAFENVKVEWSPGHVPTVYFLDEQGKTLSQLEIGNKNLSEVLELFVQHGFETQKSTPESVPDVLKSEL